MGEKPPIIYNGVGEVEQIPFKGIDKQNFNILFAGRLEYQKGIDELITVVKKCEGVVNAVFWIVGNGSLYNKVIEGIKGLNNVYLCDKIYGLSSYLSSFDYLFMPSNFEGLALLPIEASLAKVPTILNSCPGLEDTLPEDWPLKVKCNNVKEYMEIFNNLNSIDRESLGVKAYIFAKSHFLVGEMQRMYENFYL